LLTISWSSIYYDKNLEKLEFKICLELCEAAPTLVRQFLTLHQVDGPIATHLLDERRKASQSISSFVESDEPVYVDMDNFGSGRLDSPAINYLATVDLR